MERLCGLNFNFDDDDYKGLTVSALEGEQLVFIPHQTAMLLNNRLPRLLTLHIDSRNGIEKCCYDIAGKRRLLPLLRSQRPDQYFIYEIAHRLVGTIMDSAGLLLDENGYVLHEDYIFCESRNSDFSLCYLPILNADMPPFCAALRLIILKLLACSEHLNAESLSVLHEALGREKLDLRSVRAALKQLWLSGSNHSMDSSDSARPVVSAGFAGSSGSEESSAFVRAQQSGVHIIPRETVVSAGELHRAENDLLLANSNNPRSGGWNRLTDLLGRRWQQFRAHVWGNVHELENQSLSNYLGADDERRLEKYDGSKLPVAPPVSDKTVSLEQTKETIVSGCKLYIKKADHEEEKQPLLLAGERLIVGRSRHGVDYTDLSDGVSRVHCEFVRLEQGWGVRDLGSMNGTMVNGAKLAPFKTYELKHGDVVKYVETEMRFAAVLKKLL